MNHDRYWYERKTDGLLAVTIVTNLIIRGNFPFLLKSRIEINRSETVETMYKRNKTLRR